MVFFHLCGTVAPFKHLLNIRAKIACRPEGAAFIYPMFTFPGPAFSHSSFQIPILSPTVWMLVVYYYNYSLV